MSIIIDVILCLLAVLVFFLGYRKGFLQKAWWLVDLVVIILLFMMLSPTILKWIEANTAWKNSLVDWIGSFTGSVPQIQPESVAYFILKAGICLALGIVVVIIMLIVKFLLKKLITLKVFEIIDKILGGVYSVAVMTLILLVIGGVLGTFVNFAPIQSLSDTFSQTYMTKYLFGENLLQGFFDKYLPFGTWIAGIVK